jgi:hypothetical protein
MAVKIQINMETEELDPITLHPDKIILGWAELDDSGTHTAFMLRQVPDVLRQIAEALESGMTTGPDEATWLTGDPDVT